MQPRSIDVKPLILAIEWNVFGKNKPPFINAFHFKSRKKDLEPGNFRFNVTITTFFRDLSVISITVENHSPFKVDLIIK